MKRLFDCVLATLLLIGLLPILLITAMLVLVFLGRPVLFIQTRPGRFGKPFRLLKFRTMSNAVDNRGEPLPDEVRLGRFGRFLRASSLDELPSLFNVLLGDMSLVGPRPLLMEYLPLYNEVQARRHDVRPGITGWAQLNGRNALTWEEKFNLDVWYVENRTFRLDLAILLRTVGAVFRVRGISHSGHATMHKFKGNKS